MTRLPLCDPSAGSRLQSLLSYEAQSGVGHTSQRLESCHRLSPFAPFSMASYAFSMTRISFGAYLVGTIGALPALFAFVYKGSISSIALNALLLGQLELNEIQIAVVAVGFVATIAVSLLFVRIARRALISESHD